jgi:prepilin-type N-terminal cleavage/methylation domain-containing protein
MFAFQSKKQTRRQNRNGLTLVEILLAIVIFGGVVAILGEVGRNALRSASFARDTTQAELICESLMGMLLAGVIPLDIQSETPLESMVSEYPDTNAVNYNNRGESLWLSSIDIYSTEEEGLLEVVVTVRQNRPEGQRPVMCQLLRWMIDPEYLAEMEEEMEEILNPEETLSETSGNP